MQVKLQGIFLQAEPVDIVKLSTEELRKENFLLKKFVEASGGCCH